MLKSSLKSSLFLLLSIISIASRGDDTRLLYTPDSHLIKRSGEQVYKYLCRDNKQVKAFKENIEVQVIEPSKKNKPLDTFQKELKERKSKARDIAKNFFKYGTEENQEIDGLADGSDNESQSNISDLIVVAKNRRIELKPEYLQTFSDLVQLKKSYIFNIPQSVQDKVFENKKIDDNYMDHDCLEEDSDGYVGLDENCKFKASKAIKDNNRMFDYYLRKFTSVKEATSKEPNVINFEIELSLQLLCQYSVPVSEVLAR